VLLPMEDVKDVFQHLSISGFTPKWRNPGFRGTGLAGRGPGGSGGHS
jgi:hypothetical protein